MDINEDRCAAVSLEFSRERREVGNRHNAVADRFQRCRHELKLMGHIVYNVDGGADRLPVGRRPVGMMGKTNELGAHAIYSMAYPECRLQDENPTTQMLKMVSPSYRDPRHEW
jgi:hypothetical protein